MTQTLGQFWRLVKLSISGPGGKLGIVFYAVVLALELAAILVSLRMLEWTKAFNDALQQINGPEAFRQVGIFAVIIAISVSRSMLATYVRKLLEIRWRKSLTTVMLDRWMAGRAFLRMEADRRSGKPSVDNPDQRIAEDVRIFLAGGMNEHGGGNGIIPLSIDLISNVVAIFSYVTVLWSLSTFTLSLSGLGLPIDIPRYMVWAAFAYVLLCTGLTHLLGRKLKGVYFEQQRREADYRFSLVRMRENAEAIALSKGEGAERSAIDTRFGAIVTNWKRLITEELKLLSFTFPYRSTVLRIPTFLALPAFFAGAVTFGGLMQLASAFSQVVTTLSWFIFSYRPLADLAAASSRLQGFLDATEAPDAPAGPRFSGGPNLRIDNLRLSTPEGRPLLNAGGLDVAPGQAVWLSGASGLGKTTLLKAIAGLWPHAAGDVQVPKGSSIFLPQRPYLPLGDMLTGVAYPSEPRDIGETVIREAIGKVGLGDRLAAGTGIADLSGGELQRLALARVLVQRPDWVFLDEPTSALDAASEEQLLSLLRAELPNAAFIIVAHRQPMGLDALRRVELGSGPEKAASVPDFVPAE